jgi:hypothetical protein
VKIFRTLFVIFVATFLFAELGNAQYNGEYLSVDANDVFVPNGFDDNDEVVVVVDGYLPDGCYRLTRPEVDVNHTTMTIHVTPIARWWDIPCIEALIPYNFEVRLGVLPHGAYKVVVNEKRHLRERLTVVEANNSGPDDYLYAPIDSVNIANTDPDGTRTAYLEGRFTNSCLEFENIKIINDGKTVVALPIIEMQDRNDCHTGLFPFKKGFLIPQGLEEGRHLLHVRSLNGFDINTLFDVNDFSD